MDNTKILDVLIIGAGFSGICAGVRLKKVNINNFKIINKNSDIGGVWHENKYPGAVCDVPSVFYSFSFESNPNWTETYPSQAEIQLYLKNVAKKYDLLNHIKSDRKVTKMIFEEETSLWKVICEDRSIVRAKYVINGSGILQKPNYPKFLLESCFLGPIVHTARWNHKLDYSNKVISVIGTAASAIQIIPELSKIAKKINIFQRSPNYVAKRNNRKYLKIEKYAFNKIPFIYKLYRFWSFLRGEILRYVIMRHSTKISILFKKMIMKNMYSNIKSKSLKNLLTPNYSIGCKRILVSDDYYDAINEKNVELVSEKIEKINGDSIITDKNKSYKTDIIICATGFNIEKHLLSIDLVGLNNQSILDIWKDNQEAYKGACIPDFPNYFMVTGPNTQVATTSVVFVIEKQINYIVSLIVKTGLSRSIKVKEKSLKWYNKKVALGLKDSVWMQNCMSWYKNSKNQLNVLYPFSMFNLKKESEHPDIDNFIISKSQDDSFS